MQNFEGHNKPVSFLDFFKRFIVRNIGNNDKFVELCEDSNNNYLDLTSDKIKEKNNLVRDGYLEIGNEPTNECSNISKDDTTVNLADTEVIELSSDDEIDIQILSDSSNYNSFDFEEHIKIQEICQESIKENYKILEEKETFSKPNLTINKPVDFKAENTGTLKFCSNDEVELNDLNFNEDSISWHSSDFEFIEESEAKNHGLCEKVKDYKKIREHFDQGSHHENHRIPVGNEYLELFQGRYTPFPTRIMENKATRAVNAMFVQYNGIGFNMHGPKQIVSDELRKEAQLKSNLIREMYPVENTRRRRRYPRYLF